MAVKRDHLIPCVVEGRKMIDITNPHNKLWLKKQEEMGKYMDLNAVFKKPKEVRQQRIAAKKTNGAAKALETPQAVYDPKLSENLDSLREVQLEIKKATLEKTIKAIALDEIKIAKQLGQLIPFDAAKGFFLHVVESFTKSFDQESKVIADLMLARFGADQNEFIEVKRDLSKRLVEIKKDTVRLLTKGLDQIAEEYSETRSRGESK